MFTWKNMSHQRSPSEFHWDCLIGNKLNQMDLSPLDPPTQQILQWRTGRTTRYHPTDQVISLPWPPWYPSGLWHQVKSLLSGMVSAKMCQVYYLCHLTGGWPMGPYWVCQQSIPITSTTIKSNPWFLLWSPISSLPSLSTNDHSHDHQTSTVDSYNVHQSTINQLNHHSSYYGPPSTIMNNHD